MVKIFEEYLRGKMLRDTIFVISNPQFIDGGVVRFYVSM